MKRTALSPCASTADGAAFKTSVCVRSLLATTRSAPFLSLNTLRTHTPRSFHVALPSFGFSRTKALQRHLWSSVSPSSPFDASIFSGAAGAGASAVEPKPPASKAGLSSAFEAPKPKPPFSSVLPSLAAAAKPVFSSLAAAPNPPKPPPLKPPKPPPEELPKPPLDDPPKEPKPPLVWAAKPLAGAGAGAASSLASGSVTGAASVRARFLAGCSSSSSGFEGCSSFSASDDIAPNQPGWLVDMFLPVRLRILACGSQAKGLGSMPGSLRASKSGTAVKSSLRGG
ncbi:unnamed protein product, partial [Pelagomonas calceolata]